jgi:hypothetical protein
MLDGLNHVFREPVITAAAGGMGEGVAISSGRIPLIQITSIVLQLRRHQELQDRLIVRQHFLQLDDPRKIEAGGYF